MPPFRTSTSTVRASPKAGMASLAGLQPVLFSARVTCSARTGKRPSCSLRTTPLQSLKLSVGHASGQAAAPRRRLSVRAEDGTQKMVGSALKMGNQALDAAVQLLPSSIPRPVGKAGVGLLAFTISLSLIQAIFNSFVTLLFLGGLGYGAFTYFSKSPSTSSGGGGGGSGSDPLDEARRIMDKYK